MKGSQVKKPIKVSATRDNNYNARAPGAPAHLTLTLLVDNARQRQREREDETREPRAMEREDRGHGVGGDNNRLDNSFVFPAGCSLGTVYRKYRASTNVFTDVSDWSRELESAPGEMGKRK